MKRLSLGGILVFLAATCAASVQAQSTPESDPTITIDGAKNPELVPQWAAWQEAFHVMASPAEPEVPIPSNVYAVATAEQRALIRKEALGLVAEERDIGDRALTLRNGLTADNLQQRTEEVNALEMRRRQLALDVRDRVLKAMPPDVQNALREFVERVIRKGYKIVIQKSKLAQFRLPE